MVWWFGLAKSRQEALSHTHMTITHLQSLGFTLNYEKSVLIPSQQITFIGIAMDSTTMMAKLSQDRIDSFMECLSLFQVGHQVKYRTCMRAAGCMASAIHLIRLGRLHMRPFLRWMHSLKIPSSQRNRKVTLSQHCIETLTPWLSVPFLSQGVNMGEVISRRLITTDASMMGWGATMEGRSARGIWSPDLQSMHINYLELMAVYLAVKHFEPLILNCHVLIRTDNTTTMCYVNKQGGLSSRALDNLARELTIWCDSRLRSIRACHVRGLLNSGADLLSRGQPRYEDWSLNPKIATQI